jgi:CRP-like cAMP-binding protein
LRVLTAGDVVYAQGDSAGCVYNLVSGWIGLHQDMPDGRRHISKFQTTGAMFGFEPAGSSHCQGATAITDSIVCAIPSERVDGLRQRHAVFNERFVWMLERENHMSIDALTILAQGSAVERVARVFCELATRLSFHGDIRSGAPLKTPLTQRLVAEATGLTAIHVNRVIRQLRERGLVDLHDGAIIVTRPERLTEVAGTGSGVATQWHSELHASPQPIASLNAVAARL